MKTRFTRHQVPRGSRPDAEDANNMLLIKAPSVLHATYQVRLLLFRALQTGTKLVLCLPKSTKLGRDLKDLRREHRSTLRIDRM